jgi:hypothetical protein
MSRRTGAATGVALGAAGETDVGYKGQRVATAIAGMTMAVAATVAVAQSAALITETTFPSVRGGATNTTFASISELGFPAADASSKE